MTSSERGQPESRGDAFGPRSRRSGRANLRCLAGFATSIAIALSGCSSTPPQVRQNQRAADKPFATLIDNHGCKWRLDLDDSASVWSYVQVRANGSPDCPASAIEAGTAATENTGAVHESAGPQDDAQGEPQ